MSSRLRPIMPALFSVLILVQLGCASTTPRQHWWEFWRPKSVNSSVASMQPLSYEIPQEESDALEDNSYPLPVPRADGLADLSDGDYRGLIDQPLDEPMRQSGFAAPTLQPVRFGFDQYELGPEAIATLESNLDWILRNPGVQIQIEGHTDERGTIEYNLLLGERRAKAVKAYLISRGVAEDSLGTISYGEERPIETAQTESAFAVNRRAQFLAY